ncbi:hypothetical protein Bca52824_031338 [Brassica carinata]|uniref:Flavin-containing monooxygenase n=1 Tax=Brassica carinata TaxID=52824 RepID=A0A8X7V587_BRACI|nr:hypothetical protein Bca52824_031338 [Brassica carinata]
MSLTWCDILISKSSPSSTLDNLVIITQMAPSSSSIISRHVAVIGAGASGLVAASELQREGHSVVVFYRQNKFGGTWIYMVNWSWIMSKFEPDMLSL